MAETLEIIVDRSRLHALMNSLNEALKVEEAHQYKIRVSSQSIYIVPHCEPIEVDL